MDQPLDQAATGGPEQVYVLVTPDIARRAGKDAAFSAFMKTALDAHHADLRPGGESDGGPRFSSQRLPEALERLPGDQRLVVVSSPDGSLVVAMGSHDLERAPAETKQEWVEREMLERGYDRGGHPDAARRLLAKTYDEQFGRTCGECGGQVAEVGPGPVYGL